MEKAKKRKRVSTFDIINVTAMVLVGLIMLLPVLNLVAKAFSSEGNVIAGKVLFWPVDFQTSTIQYCLTNGVLFIFIFIPLFPLFHQPFRQLPEQVGSFSTR